MLNNASATLFNIVHGSFVDGWGIRTTVFLKGCPLRCLWCCNPESQSILPELQLVAEHCSGCGSCLQRCPTGALSLEDGIIQVNRSHCDGCGQCVSACWPGALHIWGKRRTANEVFEECLRDAAFYKSSGGGVTLSGGEATLQPEFCLEMLRLCHSAEIPVAIDTCGMVNTPQGIQVLQQADLILFDIKGLDPLRHRENTGVSNEKILENLRLLEKWGKEVIVRYPVIPRHNQDEAAAIAALLASLTCIRRVDLIPYHAYGTGKYVQLGREYSLDLPRLSDDDVQTLLVLFQSHGLQVQSGG